MTPAGLEQALGHRFADPALLRQALTHRSHSTPHNERLEFLGDGVLDCAIADHLYRRFSRLDEGALSRLRANLVCQDTLVGVARVLDLGHHLLLGEGELKSGGRSRPSILADALEAVFGAVYLDAGFARAAEVIGNLYRTQLEGIDPDRPAKDSKTLLQEYLQGRRLPLPQYTLASTLGEAHSQRFVAECQIDRLGLVTRGEGGSRRAAEQEAAAEAYRRLTSG